MKYGSLLTFISSEQAERNLKAELRGYFRFGESSGEGDDGMNILTGAMVEGGTLEQRRTLYSPHVSLFSIASRPNFAGDGVRMASKAHYLRVQRKGGIWRDVCRSRLSGCLSRVVSADVSNVPRAARGEITAGLGEIKYLRGRMDAKFPAPGYRAMHDGSLIDAVFADGVVKEIPELRR